MSRNSVFIGDTASKTTTWAENSLKGRHEVSGLHGNFLFKDRSKDNETDVIRSDGNTKQTNYFYFVPPQDTVFAKVHMEFEVHQNLDEEQEFWIDNVSLLESNEIRRPVNENTSSGGGNNSAEPAFIKSVGVWMRKERGWSEQKSNAIIDYTEGGKRYFVNSTPSGIDYQGFTSLYLNGEPFPKGSHLPNGGGWMLLAASIDGPNAIQPRSNRLEKHAYYNTQITEYWVWSGKGWIRRQNWQLDPAMRTDRMLFMRGDTQDIYSKIDVSDDRSIAVDGPHIRKGTSVNENMSMNIVRAALDPPNELGRRPLPIISFSPSYQNQDNVSEITAQGRWKQVVLRWVNHRNTYPAVKKYRIKVWEIGPVDQYADWAGNYYNDRIYGALQVYKTKVSDGFGGQYETQKFAREADRILEIDSAAMMTAGDFNSFKVKKLKPKYLYAFAVEAMNEFAGREQWSGTKIVGRRPNEPEIDMRSDGYLVDSWDDAVVLAYPRGNDDPEYWDTYSFDRVTIPREIIHAVDPWFEYYKDNSLEYRVMWLDRDLLPTSKKESSTNVFSWLERPIKFGGDAKGQREESAAFSQMSIKYLYVDKKSTTQVTAFDKYVDFLGGKVHKFRDRTDVFNEDDDWQFMGGSVRFIDSNKSFVG